jgi:hypothetical protein
MLVALAVSQNHPLAHRQRVTPAEAMRDPLLVFCPRDYPAFRDMLTDWLREHRQRPRITGEYFRVSIFRLRLATCPASLRKFSQPQQTKA